jgi:hypothetical protein
VDAFTCQLEEKARRYLLNACFLVIWWNVLDKEGFFMLSLGIGKELLHNCVVSSCLKVNLSKSFEEYKGIHPPSRST